MIEDSDRFFQALATMAEFFCDELSEVRQRGYWELFHERATIAEWEYTCLQAMDRETFHKVPLPAALWDYVREYREREQQKAAMRAQLQLPPGSAAPDEEGLQHIRNIQAMLEKKMDLALVGSNGPYTSARTEDPEIAKARLQEQVALGLINPPNPERWLPLNEDFSPERPVKLPHSGTLELKRVGPSQRTEKDA